MIEIIVVLAIIVVVAVIAFSEGGIFSRRVGLSRAVSDTTVMLQLARSKTIASEGLSSWGVYVMPDRLELFMGLNYASSSTNTILYLPTTVSATTSFANSTNTVVFLRPHGTTGNSGIITLFVKDSSDQRYVRIDESGIVSIDSQAPPTVPLPNQDARHVHVALGWDVRTNSVMQLIFKNPPNPDVVDTIAVVSCMDITNTIFDCTRMVQVGGENQTIRVNTHNIAGGVTDLSINRDRRENTKAVELWFDAVQIVSYDVLGNVVKGPDVLVGAPLLQ